MLSKYGVFLQMLIGVPKIVGVFYKKKNDLTIRMDQLNVMVSFKNSVLNAIIFSLKKVLVLEEIGN